MITDVEGIQVGHWTNHEARTGCTAILLPPGTVASGEIRGGAPAEREMALLEPSRMVPQIDAVILTGGSAFGLASADGAMQWLETRGRGLATPAGPVPIVVGMALFDLDSGDPSVRPGPAEGALACDAAAATPSATPVELGAVGAGTGAQVNRLATLTGQGAPQPGGLVSATTRHEDLTVSALVAVNAVGALDGDPADGPRLVRNMTSQPTPLGNTVIGVVATNAQLTKQDCHLMSQAAHDGLARSVYPAHTPFDGDAFVGVATGPHDADINAVRILAVSAVTAAIRSL